MRMMMNGTRWDGVELGKAVVLFVVLVLAWPVLQRWVLSWDVTAGYVDPSILVLVVLALLCFLVLVGLSWWLVQRFWLAMGLQGLDGLVLEFDSLDLWQKLGFYGLCYALVLLAGVGSLIAVL